MSLSVSSLALLALATLGDVTSATVIQEREVPRPRLGNVPYGSEVISCTQPGVIALTFDDGPGPLTAGIVDTLEKAGAKGTFFMVGKNGEDGLITGDYTDLIKRMHKNGHHIGSHSFTHPNFNKISYDEKVKELRMNEKAFADVLGFIPTYFRPPFTACDGECYQALGDMGYHVTDYDLDTKDWENNGADSENKYGSAVRFSNPDFNSFISLSHDIQPFTANGFVQFMLDVGKEKGYRFVTLGECLGDPAGNWYRDPETGEAFSEREPEPSPEPSPEPTPEPTTSTTTKAPGKTTTTTDSTPSASPGVQKEADSSSAVPSNSAEASNAPALGTSTITTASSTFVTTFTTASTNTVVEATSDVAEDTASPSASGDANVDESAGTLPVPSIANALIASIAGLAAWALL